MITGIVVIMYIIDVHTILQGHRKSCIVTVTLDD
jgi:hypothetical protein